MIRSGTRTRSGSTTLHAEGLCRREPAPVCASETLRPHAFREPCWKPARPASACSTSPGAAASRSEEDRRHGRGLAPADRAARLHRPGGAGASTHLSCNAPNAMIREWVRAFYTGWYTEIAEGLPVVAAGEISVSQSPGHGVSLLPDLSRRRDFSSRVSS